MLMKRILVLITSITMIFTLSSCSLNITTRNEDKSLSSIDNNDIPNNLGDIKDIKVTDPSEKVTLKMVDWSDSTKTRREEYNKQFMSENPNVTIEYTTLTAGQFKEVVVSSIKSGDAPDLFPIPNGMNLKEVIAEGWYTPLNDYIDEEFFNTFIEGSLNEGITNLNNNTYLLPEALNITNTLMYYNKTVLKESGITEEELPKTWSEFVDICKRVSEAGKGKFYGIIESGAQPNRLELAIKSFASLDGAKTGDISQIIMVDGKNTIDSQGMKNAFKLYEDITKVGGFHPDTTLLKAPEARVLFAQNQAAFIIQGAWSIATWKNQNPDLEYGVMPLPKPDSGQKGKIPYLGSQPWIGISSNSKHPDIAAKYLEGLYSFEYQSKVVNDGGFISTIKDVNENAMKDEVMKNYFELHKSEAALSPDPIVYNKDTSIIYSKASSISPGLGEIAQGVIAESADYEKELYELSIKTQEEWDNVINQYSNIIDISKEDFEFQNWDPMKNYTMEMYKEKK
ncbi:extracellular solute-binding protein [Clostridium sp.]|uniref:ABC transporter substrate-binding protein n=1 Tax=Clostridium sp. TaxID=1506 RepID=UPI00260C1EA5|nr:extracellular solute-binding protein [Clostridium sp.]